MNFDDDLVGKVVHVKKKYMHVIEKHLKERVKKIGNQFYNYTLNL